MANEKRLIDANALTDVVEHIDWYHISLQGTLAKGANSQLHTPLYKADDIYQAINDAPTVDAVEVVHGRWNTTCLTGGFAEEWGYVCSVCGCIVSDKSRLGKYQGSNQQLNYCPNCGAKMDGGNEDDI